jgi:hypothetical protein
MVEHSAGVNGLGNGRDSPACLGELVGSPGMAKFAGVKDMTFKVGNEMWLSTQEFRMGRPLNSLDNKLTGLYTVSKIISKNTYNLDQRKTIQNHNIFHQSQLEHSTPPVVDPACSEPYPQIVDESEGWEVKRIHVSKLHSRKLRYCHGAGRYNSTLG